MQQSNFSCLNSIFPARSHAHVPGILECCSDCQRAEHRGQRTWCDWDLRSREHKQNLLLLLVLLLEVFDKYTRSPAAAPRRIYLSLSGLRRWHSSQLGYAIWTWGEIAVNYGVGGDSSTRTHVCWHTHTCAHARIHKVHKKKHLRLRHKYKLSCAFFCVLRTRGRSRLEGALSLSGLSSNLIPHIKCTGL